MTDKIVLEFPFSLNIGKTKEILIHTAPSFNIQLREHFSKRTARKEAIMELIKTQLVKYQVELPFRRCGIRFERFNTVLSDPIDNLGASFKAIGDALVALKIIADDNPNVIGEMEPIQHKIKKITDRKVLVTIWPLKDVLETKSLSENNPSPKNPENAGSRSRSKRKSKNEQELFLMPESLLQELDELGF